MANIRIIHYSNESGSREGVYFTIDLDKAADEIIPHGCTLDSDTETSSDDGEFPSSFPFDYHLIKTHNV